MIYGRSTALWAGLVAAVLNVIGLLWVVVSGAPLDANTVALFAGLNALALAIIGVLANVSATGTAFGRGMGGRGR
jgi:hypothetical protein